MENNFNKLAKELEVASYEEKNMIMTIKNNVISWTSVIKVDSYNIYDDQFEVTGNGNDISFYVGDIIYDEDDEEYIISNKENTIYLHFCKKV